MNNLNVYSFISDFDIFLDYANNIDIIEFSEPPIQFNHWCSNNETLNCLDCAYIKKYKVKDYYLVLDNLNISIFDKSNIIINTDNQYVCLLFHFKITNGKKYLYISIYSINSLDSDFESTLLTTETIRDLLELVGHN